MLFVFVFLFLQGHLISNQRFVFVGAVFVFVGGLSICKNTVCTIHLAKAKFERLMCEVEFWEVFLKRC